MDVLLYLGLGLLTFAALVGVTHATERLGRRTDSSGLFP